MTSERPLIGITGFSIAEGKRIDVDGSWFGLPDQRFVIFGGGYIDQVAAAGGLPICLPVIDDPLGQLDALDALIITGGEDVSPALYGEDAHPRTVRVSPERDRHEAQLFEAADIPVLLVCRGMQLANVALGGTLEQHIEGHDPNAGAESTFHEIDLEAGSALAEAYGSNRIRVNSYHHQAIGRLGQSITATARAPDGTIEAIEIDRRAATVGVQWHPEIMGAAGLATFEWLVDQTRATD